jgi:ATP-binding cassette subfamily B protein
VPSGITLCQTEPPGGAVYTLAKVCTSINPPCRCQLGPSGLGGTEVGLLEPQRRVSIPGCVRQECRVCPWGCHRLETSCFLREVYGHRSTGDCRFVAALVKQRWGIPGRVRFDVAPMISNPALAAALEVSVGAQPHVGGARANPASGSLLVTYDPAVAPQDIAANVQHHIESWFDRSRPTSAAQQQAALARVLTLSSRGPGDLVGPGLLSAGGYALSTLQGLSLGAIIAVAMGETPSIVRRLFPSRGAPKLLHLTTATLLVTAATNLVNIKRRQAWRRFGQDAQHRLRVEVFARLEEQDIAFFDEHGTGELLALLTADVGRIGALNEEADSIMESFLTIASASIALLAVAPSIGVIAIGALLLMLLPVRALKPRVEESLAESADATGRLNQALENILSGVVEVKSFTAEPLEAARVTALSQDVAARAVRTTKLTMRQAAVGGMFFYDGYTLAMSYGASRVISKQIPSERLTQVNFWYPRLISSIGRVMDASSVYYAARGAAERLCAILDSRPHVHDGNLRLEPAGALGEIVMDNVSFGYHPSTPVLHDVSFRLPAGKILGIVGPSGSGKSTLLRLLLRFYDPLSGRIFLDGHDLRDVKISDLRASIAVVAQDPYLFNDTVRNNVRYGRPQATDEEIIRALTDANAEELLGTNHEGLESYVGERGGRLSGGQRQRLAIARALVKAAPILALDEPTAHLDYQTEATVWSSLKRTAAGKAVILVAHRLTCVRDADHIIVLEKGRLREEGNHESLLERRGLYYELWQLQDGLPER